MIKRKEETNLNKFSRRPAYLIFLMKDKDGLLAACDVDQARAFKYLKRTPPSFKLLLKFYKLEEADRLDALTDIAAIMDASANNSTLRYDVQVYLRDL